jgi:hypothetical protein
MVRSEARCRRQGSRSSLTAATRSATFPPANGVRCAQAPTIAAICRLARSGGGRRASWPRELMACRMRRCGRPASRRNTRCITPFRSDRGSRVILPGFAVSHRSPPLCSRGAERSGCLVARHFRGRRHASYNALFPVQPARGTGCRFVSGLRIGQQLDILKPSGLLALLHKPHRSTAGPDSHPAPPSAILMGCQPQPGANRKCL